ncbi:50S ribosomal protein L25 [bacterium]|nr:50S ribosomal protein L25 [bacterium]
MQQLRLDAQFREFTGKGAARVIRRNGMVPGILYGLQKDNTLLQIDERNLRRIISAEGFESTLINLEIGDTGSEVAIIKEIQRDPVSREIFHADFMRISLEQEITVNVPVILLGSPLGVRVSNGVQEFAHRELGIRCLPTVIPEHIELDVTDLLIGDLIRVSDIKPEGIEVLDDPETIIITIRPPRVVAVEEPVAEEVAEEPEVITRRRDEETEEVE